jgi:hypothetical protein
MRNKRIIISVLISIIITCFVEEKLTPLLFMGKTFEGRSLFIKFLLTSIFVSIFTFLLLLFFSKLIDRLTDDYHIIAILIYGAPLISHAYIGFYSRFMADDYSSAAKAKTLGIIKSAVYWYQHWNGRYSANLFDSIMGFLGPKFTPFSTVTIITIWVVVLIGVIYLFIKTYSKNGKYFIEASLIAFMILFATFEVTPNLAQSLYWGQGMRSVVPPLIIATLIVGVFQYCLEENKLRQNSIKISVLVSGLTFIAGGFAETYVAIQTFVFFSILILGIFIGSPYYKKKISKHITFGFLFSTISMLIMIMAPGNQYRQIYLPSPPGLFDLIWISANSMLDYFIRLLRFPLNISVLFGSFMTSMILGSGQIIDNLGYQKIYSLRVVKKVLTWVLPIALSMIFASFLPAAYGSSSGPPGRTLIIPTYILICAITTTGYFWGLFFYKNFRKKQLLRKPFIQLAIQLIFLLFLINTIYSTKNILDLQPKYSVFAEKWDQVDYMIKKAKIEGETTIIVPMINNPAGLSNIEDVPINWVNRAASDYYGILIIADDSLKFDTYNK